MIFFVLCLNNNLLHFEFMSFWHPNNVCNTYLFASGRTFGQRHGHPPPLLRTHSQPPSASSSSSSSQSRAQNNSNICPSNASQRHNPNATTSTVSGQIPVSATSLPDSNRYHQTPHLSLNPMENMMAMTMGGGNFSSGNNVDIYRLHGVRHGSGGGSMSTSSPGGSGSPHEYYMGSTGGDPVIGLSAGQYYLRSSNAMRTLPTN